MSIYNLNDDCLAMIFLAQDDYRDCIRFAISTRKLHSVFVRISVQLSISHTVYYDGGYYLCGKLHRDDDKPAFSGKIDSEYYASREYLFSTYEEYKNAFGSIPVAEELSYEWWYKGKRHRNNDKPAIIHPEVQIWHTDGEQHRDNDEPAIISDIMKKWYKHGLLHRDNDKPAVIHDFMEVWYKNGKRHRDNDKPAYVSDYAKKWYQNGLIYRGGGLPAVVVSNNETNDWYQCGKINHIARVNQQISSSITISDADE